MNKAKNKQDVMTVYRAYWDSYFKGDMETMASFIADDFQVIGSTEGEVFLDKRETMQFYKATSGQVTGKVEFRNRNIQEKLINGCVSVTEFSDAYILIEDEWVFYSKLRITSLLEKKENGWKFVKQHGSMPDSRTEEGEQLAFEKIRQENLELREAVKRRTIELENKNRELQIEASLERVRARALSMNKPADMLEVCRVISNQLQQFKVEHVRNVQTVIINESKRTYLNYQYFTAYDRLVTEETDPAKHPTVLEMVHAMQKSADSFFSGVLTGHKLDEFRKYRKKENQFPDPILEETETVYYYFYSIGQGGLGVTTYKPLPSEGLDIFKRFHNVFKLAYRRFLDIEKAEAQAREAQIEASLERIRALALGMHRSEEVGNVSDGFFVELNKLTLKLLGCSIVVIDQEKDIMELWRARSDVALKPFAKHSFSSTMTILKKKLPDFFLLFYKALQEKNDSLMYELSGNKRIQFFNTVTEQGKYSEKDKTKLFQSIPDNVFTHYIFFKLGYLVLISENILPDENLAIARRFVDVFDFAYTRFIDIKKAEEQAREAQIEMALEKVRSRTMGMQKSDELPEVANHMFVEIKSLDIPVWSTAFNIFSEDKSVVTCNVSSEGQLQPAFKIPLMKEKSFKEWYDAIKNKESFFVQELGGKDLVKHYEYLFTLPGVRDAAQPLEDAGISLPTFQINHICPFKNGFLLFITYEKVPEAHGIFKRFSKVFEQTYTRFLDLQKAEAQAREAQIEAALERVRSRSMAMNSSDELLEASDVMFAQLEKLEINALRIGICTIDSKTGAAEIWSRSEIKGKIKNSILGVVPSGTHTVFDEMVKAWKENKAYFASERVGDEVKEYYTKLASCLSYPEPNEYNERETVSAFFFSHGSLNVISLEPLKEEESEIMIRFAKVFGQIYQRFLDLQKAEAQAREARIETALERVRAKAMAMHNSDDLAQTVDVFFKELKNLDVTPRRCGVTLIDEETRIADLTVTTAKGKNTDLKMTGKLTLAGHPVLENVYNSWKQQKEFHPVLKGQEIKDYYNAMNPEIEYPDSTNDEIQYGHYFYFKEGGVFAWTDKELPESSLNIFRKFTSVLSLTYRRYLDLIEAEAQAREAQIEAALERVRTLAMSMHKSNDLTKAVATVFSELRHLGLYTVRCGIGIMQGKNKMVDAWTTSATDKNDSLHISGNEKLEGHPLLEKIFSCWQNQKDFAYLLKGKDLESYYEVTSQTNLKVPAPKIEETPKKRLKQYYYCVMFPAGGLFAFRVKEFSEEAKILMRRFSDVFHLAFTRHLDLKQAEEQNKIIQAENERKTKELEEARRMQLSMLPKELPKVPNLDIAVYMKTATEVGGDYYDFVTHEDGSLNICLGDATGHGMKAGIMVSSMKSIFTTNAPKMGIEQFFETANAGIKSMNLMHMMMGMVMVNIDSKSFKLINAGMPPVFFYSSKSDSIHEIKEHGLPVGAMRLSNYKIVEGSLQKGDILLLLSDGMPELADKNNEMFGYNRLLQTFNTVTDKEPDEIIDHLKNVAAHWADNKDPDDDVTFVLIKMK